MKRRDLVAVLAIAVATVVATGATLYALPILRPPQTATLVPSRLPLEAGTTFSLLPRSLPNGTVVYHRSFSTNLTASCQFVQGSWEATAPTTTFLGTGLNGTFFSFLFPQRSLFNGSLAFAASAPDTIRILETVQATDPSPCTPPVTLDTWGVYNSGNMCGGGVPPPPWELRYDFVLQNAATVNMVADLDFFFTARNATGLQYALAGTGTFTVPAKSNTNLTETLYYFDCPWGTGGTASFAIVDESPVAP